VQAISLAGIDCQYPPIQFLGLGQLPDSVVLKSARKQALNCLMRLASYRSMVPLRGLVFHLPVSFKSR
jgi:hypothetical protein